MKIKGMVCESGGKKAASGRLINEDGLITFNVNYNGREYEFIILMDGATGLGKSYEIIPDATSAEWYVEFMMAEMRKKLLENPINSLFAVVDECVEKAADEISKYEKANDIRLEEYQKPSAGFSLLRSDGKTTDIYLIGDTQTLVAYKDGNVDAVDNPNQKALQKLDNSVLVRMIKLARERDCNVIDTRAVLEIEKMLQENRNKKNTNCEGSYWVCGTTLKSAEHGICVNFDNENLDGIILATDGFDYTVLQLSEEEVYRLIKEKGTVEVAKMIRDRQVADPFCNRFPRFKKSDDLTVVHFDCTK